MSPTSGPVVDATQGYGHFYFAPPYFTRGYRSSSHRNHPIKVHENPKTISEPSPFKTCLPQFPFMKLPVEIRHIIYNMLLAALTEDRSGLQFREEFPGVAMGQGFRFKVFEIDHDDSGDTGLLWQRPYYEVEIKEGRVPPFDEKCYSHPDRGSNLALPGTCDDLGMKECQAIHHLSHVSRQFTSELGECLWGNAVINIQCPDLFFDFFEDRPQIWKHVKGISLFIYWTNIDDSANFGALLLRISKFERLKSWITAFRGLKIGEKFTVHIEPFTAMSNLDHRVKKLSTRLSDLWLPDSLRAAKVKV